MVVSFNPQMKIDSGLTFKQNQNASSPLADSNIAASPAPEKKTLNKSVANVAYGWVNFSESVKGIIRATVSAAVVGTAVAGFDFLKSLFKKKEGMTFFQKLQHPKQALGKIGKYGAPIAAAVVFAANILLTRFRINQKTANVDHALYEGHRDK